MAQGDMPYTIEKEGDKWCVYDKASGKKIEEFGSRMAAMNKVRELMKSPKKEKETKAEASAPDEESE